MNTALHLVALRSDSVRGTILRKRPDTSQLSNVWVDGKPEVMQGDVVLVLRVNAEGEHGFSFIRMMTEDGFAEGFIRSSYLTLRPLGTSVVAVAAVHRGDRESSTMLRCRADSSKDDSVWVEGRHCVKNGDIVQALQLNAEGQSGFSHIRTRDGHEGFIRAEYLRVRPVPANCIAKATVHRLDGEASSMLRRLPVLSRESSVWVQGHHGECVEVLRMNAATEDGFCWIKTASGVSGFIRSDYICVRSAVVHAAVVSGAATDTAASMSASASHDEHDDASKAAAIKAFHTAIRSTSSVSQQKAMLRDLWAFLIRSPFRERSPDGTSDFSLAHFALAEDSLTDVLSETLVLAVSGDTAVSSSTIADALGFLPKDSFFKSLVQFVFASDEQIHLAAFSATRQVIHAFLLYDSDFAASVRNVASSSALAQSLLAGCALSDDFSQSIVARAVACLLFYEPDGSTGMCDSKIIAKLFDDFGIVAVQARVCVGCDQDCEMSHEHDGACLLCGAGWGPHNGHSCPRTRARGSWVQGGGSAHGLPVTNPSPVLTPLRMQGELLLGRLCAQIAASQTSAAETEGLQLLDLCHVVHIITVALHPHASDPEPKFQVDSLACALLNFMDTVRLSQSDVVLALNQLASRLGQQHLLTRHVQAVLSGYMLLAFTMLIDSDTRLSVLSRNPSAASSVLMRSLPPISSLVVAGIDKRNAFFAFSMEQEDIRAKDSFLTAVFAEANKVPRATLGYMHRPAAACVCLEGHPCVAVAEGEYELSTCDLCDEDDETGNGLLCAECDYYICPDCIPPPVSPMSDTAARSPAALEADTRDLFADAASQPAPSGYMQAVDGVLNTATFSLLSASASTSFGWIHPESSADQARIAGSLGRQLVMINPSSSANVLVHSSVLLDSSWQWTIEFINHKGKDTWVGVCSQLHIDKFVSGTYSDDDGLGSDAFSFGIHHKKGVRHAGRILASGTRWKTGQRLKLVYDKGSGQLSFYCNDVLMYTADGVPTEGMFAAVSSPMEQMKFRTLSCHSESVVTALPENVFIFTSSLNSAFSKLKTCSAAQLVSILQLISALDNRKSLAYLKTQAKAVLVPAASRCLLSMSTRQLESLFGLCSRVDIRFIETAAECLAAQPLQDSLKQMIPLIKSASLDLLQGQSKLSSSALSFVAHMFERISRGLFGSTLAAFSSLSSVLGRKKIQARQSRHPIPCETILIPRWVLEDVDPVRAYAQVLTFGDHKVTAVLGLGFADVRIGGQVHRISMVAAQLLWALLSRPGLSNSELSELCHVSVAVIESTMSELYSIGAVAATGGSLQSDDVPTVMGSAALPHTSIHIGSACITAVVWLCQHIKEANGVLDEVRACTACVSATGSSPAIIVSVVTDLVRRGIMVRTRGYLVAPSVGGDASQVALLPPSTAFVHSSPAPWELIAPFERLVLVQIAETPSAYHAFSSSSSASACVDEASFSHDLTLSLAELVQFSPSGDILAVADFFQKTGSVISCAAMSVLNGVSAPEIPAVGAMSLHASIKDVCPVCLNTEPMVAAPCGHSVCLDCHRQHFLTAIADSRTPARALGKGGLVITNMKCSFEQCSAPIPLSFVQKLFPELSLQIIKALSSVVISNLTAGQCAFARCICSAILVAPTQECEAFCGFCGRAASIGNFKRQNFSEAWSHHADLSSHESLNWKILNSSGNSDRRDLLRYKPCPGCGVMSTRCGCDPKNIVCDMLDKCPQERCDHMTCSSCSMNWCWVCSAKNSRESRCSRAKTERRDRKERFLMASNAIEKLKTSVQKTSFLAAPTVRQRVASRLIRQFFDGDAHHAPFSLEQLQLMPPHERRLILLPRVISLIPPSPPAEFISWSTIIRASAAIESIPLAALSVALELQSDAEATDAIITLLGIPLPPKPVLRFPPLKKGDCVRRGPDWKWGDQDSSGEGSVTEGVVDRTDGWVQVRWKNGQTNAYRYSEGAGGFDVVIADSVAADTVTLPPQAAATAPFRHPGNLSACGGNIRGVSACQGSGNCGAGCKQCGAGTHWWLRFLCMNRTCCGSTAKSSSNCLAGLTREQAEANDRLFRLVVRKSPVPCSEISGILMPSPVSSDPVKAGGGASSAAPAWPAGAAVELSPAHAKHGDAAAGPLKPGQSGTIVMSDELSQAVLVRTAAGRQWWYSMTALSAASSSCAAASSSHTMHRYTSPSVKCPRCGMWGPSTATGEQECIRCRLCEACCQTCAKCVPK